MTETIEELLVRARPEGIDETSDQLEDLEENFAESAEQTGEIADEMTSLAVEWEGAMFAILTGLVIAGAGLASQIPVLGELMGGLEAIISAVAVQIDQVLRPVLQPLTDLLFAASNALFELDGIAGDIVGVLGALIGFVAPLVLLVAKGLSVFTDWGSTFEILKAGARGLFGAIKSGLSTLAGFVSGSLAAAAAVGALLGTLAVGILEVTGVLDAIRSFGRQLSAALPGFVRDAILSVIAIFAGGLATIGGFIVGFVKGFLRGGLVEGFRTGISTAARVFDQLAGAVGRTIDRLIGNAMAWGQSLLSDFEAGVREAGAGVTRAVAGLIADIKSAFEDMIEQAVEWGKGLIDGFVKGIRSNVDKAVGAVNGLVDEVRGRLPGSPAEQGPLSDLDETGPGLVEEFAAGIEGNVTRVRSAADSVAQGAADGSAGSDQERFRGSQNRQPLQVFLDGREVQRGLRSHEDRETNRRGRFG